MYSAHRLVLALSSHYFRLVVTGHNGEGKHPVIFLKVGLYIQETSQGRFSYQIFLQVGLEIQNTSPGRVRYREYS